MCQEYIFDSKEVKCGIYHKIIVVKYGTDVCWCIAGEVVMSTYIDGGNTWEEYIGYDAAAICLVGE